MHLNDLKGPILVAPSPTPFNDNQQVNLDAIKSNASKWLQTELSGFVLGTENGEEQLLSIEERLSIVESVSEVAKNKKLIIGGVDNPSIKNTLLESEALVSAGVDILRIRIPRRRDTIDKYFDEILPKIPAPALIIHQMAPGGFANSMTLEGASPEQIGRFCSHDNVEGYISSHLVRFEMMARKFVPQQKCFWLPNAMLMVAQIVEGANGGCFMFGNIAPQVCRKIMSLALENKIAVFAEKPLTTKYQTSLELYELAKKFNLPNMIDFEFTEIPEWIEAKNIIETEKIGKILSVELNWTFLSHDLANGIKSWKTNIEKGGGALSLVFSHSFYYLEYFLGKIKNIDCSLSSSKISLNHGDTTIDMKLLFENGCNGNIHVDISDSKNQKHIIKFLGSNGELILENISHDFLDNFKLKLQQNNEIQKILYVQKLNFLNDVNEDPRIKFVANLTNKFINWCNTGIPAKPNFQDGLRVEKLIEIARTSNHNT